MKKIKELLKEWREIPVPLRRSVYWQSALILAMPVILIGCDHAGVTYLGGLIVQFIAVYAILSAGRFFSKYWIERQKNEALMAALRDHIGQHIAEFLRDSQGDITGQPREIRPPRLN